MNRDGALDVTDMETSALCRTVWCHLQAAVAIHFSLPMHQLRHVSTKGEQFAISPGCVQPEGDLWGGKRLTCCVEGAPSQTQAAWCIKNKTKKLLDLCVLGKKKHS